MGSVSSPAGTLSPGVADHGFRDEIPARIKEKGDKDTVARIAKSESWAALVIKMYEELQELLSAQAPREVAAELADLLEIIRSLCLATGVDFPDVERGGACGANLCRLRASSSAGEQRYKMGRWSVRACSFEVLTASIT